jgi:NAD(P)-dependent dehydrogenase (short-subunit alcohol dehydrogenase family)
VTGSTGAIGRAIAHQFAVDGFELVVTGRDETRAARIAAAIVDEGGHARHACADLTEPADIASLVEAAGPVEVLVNNAGVFAAGPTGELSGAEFSRLFTANVLAGYLVTAAIAPGMAERGSGSIINIGSILGRLGMPGGAAYSATKAALDALTRSWAAEYSPRGIRVNTVAPGPVHTEDSDPAQIEAFGKATLLNRAALPEEVAQAVSFLASSRAAYITGATVPVDGGRTAI